jgi:alpha/beta superfamily hydrolase
VLPFITLFNHKTHATALTSLAKELVDTVPSSSSPVPLPMLVLYGDHDQFTGIGRYGAWVKSLQGVGNLPSGTNIIADIKIVGGDHFWRGEALDHMLIEVEKWINGTARIEPDHN